MLRPRNPLSTSQLNQENAHHQSQHHLAAAKTPARQIGGAGPSKGLATGGLTARSGRVLGQKDGNKASKGPDGTERGGKDEPFDPGFEVDAFEGVGDKLRSMPLGGGGEGVMSYEEWEELDRFEREQFKAELDLVEALRPAQSTTSLRSTKSSSTSVLSRAEKEEARAKEEREAEEELGIFGVVGEEFKFEDEFAIDAEFEGQEEFRFDV
ncbi:hypothetical protein MNV49_004545 [Pseudohyphozyma bogoriensis]|nr:hypothetical protein MNV49_004545 [Pseudohyphozyma bogoriensis]